MTGTIFPAAARSLSTSRSSLVMRARKKISRWPMRRERTFAASRRAAKVRSRLLGQRLLFFLARITRDDLLVLSDLAAAGKIVPVIDRTYPLREAGEAVRYFGTGRAGGKVVITVR